jgi:hypothetical protein
MSVSSLACLCVESESGFSFIAVLVQVYCKLLDGSAGAGDLLLVLVLVLG